MQFFKHKGRITNAHLSKAESEWLDDYARGIAKDRMQQFLNGLEVKLGGERIMGAQLMTDLTLIALNRRYHFGEKRVAAFLHELENVVEEYCTNIAAARRDDPNFDLEKGHIDRVLKRVMGANFEPWESRYETSDRIDDEWIAALAKALGDKNAVHTG